MNDNRSMPPPLPPTPVLSYEIAAPPIPFWVARLVCGLAIANGAVSAGYIAASRIPVMNSIAHPWSDLPVAVCGVVLVVFGSMGIFRVSGSRMGIAISALLLMLCNWMGQWVSLRLYGPPDNSSIAYALVGCVDNAVVPIFVVVCLFREPIKGYFTSRER